MSAARQPGVRRRLAPVAVLIGLAAAWVGGSGCGGVYEEVAPPQKRRVMLVLKPDYMLSGEQEKQIGAFVEVDPAGAFVTAIDMSADVEVVAYDSRGNKGCAGIPDPPEFEASEPFRLCLTLALLPGAAVGERRVNIEVRAGGEPVIGESLFFVARGVE